VLSLGLAPDTACNHDMYIDCTECPGSPPVPVTYFLINGAASALLSLPTTPMSSSQLSLQQCECNSHIFTVLTTARIRLATVVMINNVSLELIALVVYLPRDFYSHEYI
jgi:hypothetical protein